MTELIDKVIDQALFQGTNFDTITLDFWSYEKLHEELGQKKSKLIGYKGYKIEYKLEGVFGTPYFYIKLTSYTLPLY